ncbi:CD151 antigen-like isoform X2 [Xenopus laevis]|nr:CD151 antigen-like isoform X2 [Xenopus laevis]
MNITVALFSYSVPRSCCHKVTQKCGEKVMEHQNNIFLEGCVTKMKTWISQHVAVIGAVGVGLGFVQLFGILLSFLLVKILQENDVSL